MFYVYVLLSLKDKQFYIGCTKDLKKRIFQHNQGESFSTKDRRPFELVYYEACLSKYDMRAREKYLKSGMGHRYIKNRLKNFL
jgi:putative endonuclease